MKTTSDYILHFIITFIRGNRAANEFSELVYEREGSALPLALWRLPFVHYHRHAVGQFRPVRVQTATPARGEPREEPGLLLTGPVARAFLLSRFAVARLLQANIPDQVPAKGGPACLLNVQKHNHIISLDVEIDVACQIALREVEFGRTFRWAVFLRVIGGRVWSGRGTDPNEFVSCPKMASLAACRTNILVPNHDKKNG